MLLPYLETLSFFLSLFTLIIACKAYSIWKRQIFYKEARNILVKLFEFQRYIENHYYYMLHMAKYDPKERDEGGDYEQAYISYKKSQIDLQNHTKELTKVIDLLKTGLMEKNYNYHRAQIEKVEKQIKAVCRKMEAWEFYENDVGTIHHQINYGEPGYHQFEFSESEVISEQAYINRHLKTSITNLQTLIKKLS